MFELIVAGFMFVALVFYAVTGDADYGAGMWDLLATGPRADAQRSAIERAIGELDIPLVARPGVEGPPVPGCPPGTGLSRNPAVNAIRTPNPVAAARSRNCASGTSARAGSS